MILKVSSIPEDGMNVEASAALPTAPEPPSSNNIWFREILGEAFQEDFPAGSKALLDVHLIRTFENILLTGEAAINLKPICDRCAEPFQFCLQVPMKMNLVPIRDITTDEGEKLEAEDVEFSFYEGDEINVKEIVRELVVLSVPFKHLCHESCKGLCPQCGQNLNTKTCGCKTEKIDPRFAVLQKLKKS